MILSSFFMCFVVFFCLAAREASWGRRRLNARESNVKLNDVKGEMILGGQVGRFVGRFVAAREKARLFQTAQRWVGVSVHLTTPWSGCGSVRALSLGVPFLFLFFFSLPFSFFLCVHSTVWWAGRCLEGVCCVKS